MLSIDNTHLEDDMGLHLLADSSEPMLPATRDKTLSVPGKHGTYDLGSYIGARPLNASIMMPSQATLTDVQQIVRDVASLLLDDYGQPKEVEIKYDYEPNKFYNAKFSGSIDVNRIAEAGLFQIPFTAHDPYAYSTIYADEISWGSEELTFESSYLLGHEGSAGTVDITSPTTLDITVSGYAIKPIIEISGTADSLTVTNNGQSFSLPSFSNVDWTIDCERYMVTKDGQSAFGEVRIREFWLNKGDNNVQIDGNNIDISMRVRFRDKWM